MGTMMRPFCYFYGSLLFILYCRRLKSGVYKQKTVFLWRIIKFFKNILPCQFFYIYSSTGCTSYGVSKGVCILPVKISVLLIECYYFYCTALIFLMYRLVRRIIPCQHFNIFKVQVDPKSPAVVKVLIFLKYCFYYLMYRLTWRPLLFRF